VSDTLLTGLEEGAVVKNARDIGAGLNRGTLWGDKYEFLLDAPKESSFI
jgi:hypothetical protein